MSDIYAAYAIVQDIIAGARAGAGSHVKKEHVISESVAGGEREREKRENRARRGGKGETQRKTSRIQWDMFANHRRKGLTESTLPINGENMEEDIIEKERSL